MNDGCQSLDFVETTSIESIRTQRLQRTRTVHLGPKSATRAPRGERVPGRPLLVIVTGISEAPNEIKETAARLEDVSALPPNWDGFGAVPPSQENLVQASALLAALHESTVRTSLPWQAPHVAASESGEVMFEWWHAARKLTLYIAHNKEQYIKVWGPRIEEDMQDGELRPGDFDNLWAWLHSR